MKRFLTLLYVVLKAKKKFLVRKKKYVIFDCVNSEILSKILPKNETYIISSRVNKIKTIFVNPKTIFFLINNFFKRSMTVNYFISIISQINPRFVITTIDNSLTFSILTKYFENNIKFVAIQNATRGEFTKNINNHNKIFYFTNYMGLGEFDFKLMKKKKIKVKKFFSVGSLKNSYFKNLIYLKKDNLKKKYDICFVCKSIFEKNNLLNDSYTKVTILYLKFIAKYIKSYNKKIVIQSKSISENILEKKIYSEIFKNNYKLCWRGSNFQPYKNISNSRVVIGAPSTLLREAFLYANTKILSFSDKKDTNLHPFRGLNFLNNPSYKKFEQRLNLLSKLNYSDYLKKLKYKPSYIISKTNSMKYILNTLKKDSSLL